MNQMLIPFNNANLCLVEHNGQPYVPMRPVAEGMGLDWKTQYRKIIKKFSTCVVKMTMQLQGDTQSREMILMPLRKLPAWLYSIEPNKVKPELKDTVIKYQEECDDVLWNHWSIKLSARQKAQDELDKLLLEEAISKEKGSFHGKGLNARKIEKHCNEPKIKIAIKNIQHCLELIS